MTERESSSAGPEEPAADPRPAIPNRSAVPPPPPSRPRRATTGGGGGFWRWLLRMVGVLALVVAVALAGVLLIGFLVLGVSPEVERGSWLEVRFTADYPEQRPSRTGLQGALSPTDLSAQDLLFALRRVEADPRVEGVLLRPGGFSGGWAQARELHAALRRVEETGKRVVCYLQDAGPVDYYLATAASRILVAPEGGLRVPGLEARLVFLKGTLEKVGAEADFVAVGEYKSAPEQLKNRNASEPNRRQVADYLDDVHGEWMSTIADRRGMTTDRISMLVDRALLDADQALAEGMVDGIVDRGGLWGELLGDIREPPVLDPFELLRRSEAPSRGRGIALVYVDGAIVTGRSGVDTLDGPLAGSDTVVERLDRAADDDRVAAVVLRIDSPGGSALASDLIHRQVLRTRARKPVVASMANTAASGGYYVAMGADHVIADPLTLTGSIGVYAGKIALGDLYDKLGLSFETFERGENADLFSELHPFREDQRAQLRGQLERFYARFVERVAEGRGMDRSATEAVARGRIWSGVRARDRGLIDELGGLDVAISTARRLGGLDPRSDSPVLTYQPHPGLYESLLQSLLRPEGTRSSRTVAPDVPATLRALAAAVRTLDGTVQFHLPWQIEIR